MKIAQVNLQQDHGGAEVHVQMLASGLRARGHDVRLFCHPDARLRREAERRDVRTCPLRVCGQLAPTAFLRLAARLCADRPDVLHLHTPKDYLCGMLAARLAGVRAVVLTRHMLLPLKPLMRLVYGRASAVVCLSRGLRDTLQAQGIRPDKLRLIYGAIDTDVFAAPAVGNKAFCLSSSEQADASGVTIGCVARLVVGKGHNTLLDAFARCMSSDGPHNLVLVGEGPERGALEAQAGRLGIRQNVYFVGYSDDIAAVLATLDIVVTPSTLAGLLPLSVMEAMAAARPVIAAHIGGVPEIISDARLGWLVPPGDVGALADALCDLSASSELRRQMGSAGAAHVQAHFALPRLLDETEALYTSLLVDKPGWNQSKAVCDKT